MSAAPHPELLRWREQFPILQRKCYLNSCSLGALSLRSMAYLTEFQECWNEHGASAWYEIWLGRCDELRAVVAEILGATPAEVALVPSVSAGLTTIASAVDHSGRPRVVVAEPDFPTIAHQWLARPDVEVVRVPSRDGISVELDDWAAAIDERTAVVATSHVFYASGRIQDVRSIAELAHAAGALFLVDGYQAMGQIPVDPRAIGVDVYLAGPLKWMLGGPGLAYLWVRAERISALTPTIGSWFAMADQFGFDAGSVRFREDARRFSMGTPSMPSVYAALGGAEILREVGVQHVRERVAALTEDLIPRLRDRGLKLRTARDRQWRSGIVMVEMPDAAGAVARLASEGVVVDHRAGCVRVSPHFYNTEEENRRFVDALVSSR